jgi:hypothetical protein
MVCIGGIVSTVVGVDCMHGICGKIIGRLHVVHG